MRYLPLVLLVGLLTGCVSQKDMVVTNPAAVRPAKPQTAPIAVFMGEEHPTRPYTQVGVATATNEDLRDNVQDLQDQARKVGADAVIVRPGNRAREDITNEGVIAVWTTPGATPSSATPPPASQAKRAKSHRH